MTSQELVELQSLGVPQYRILQLAKLSTPALHLAFNGMLSADELRLSEQNTYEWVFWEND